MIAMQLTCLPKHQLRSQLDLRRRHYRHRAKVFRISFHVPGMRTVQMQVDDGDKILQAFTQDHQRSSELDAAHHVPAPVGARAPGGHPAPRSRHLHYPGSRRLRGRIRNSSRIPDGLLKILPDSLRQNKRHPRSRSALSQGRRRLSPARRPRPFHRGHPTSENARRSLHTG